MLIYNKFTDCVDIPKYNTCFFMKSVSLIGFLAEHTGRCYICLPRYSCVSPM